MPIAFFQTASKLLPARLLARQAARTGIAVLPAIPFAAGQAAPYSRKSGDEERKSAPVLEEQEFEQVISSEALKRGAGPLPALDASAPVSECCIVM